MITTALLTTALSHAQIAKSLDIEYKIPFEAYTCRDRFGRTISFYLSPAKNAEKLPVAIMIAGSGGQSVWTVQDGKVYGGLQNLLERVGKGRYRVLVVEKPGVPFGYGKNQPGTAIGATPEFCEEHTLERWTEAIHAALRATHKLRGVDRSRTLAVGHSEGGIVAAKLAAVNKNVTHVANLAGGGPTQLYDFFQFFGRTETVKTWQEIRLDPLSATKLVWGHPYRRWTTFTETSPLEEALKSKAKFFIAQGSADTNSLPASAEVLYSTLVAKGRDVTLHWLEGADHGFQQAESKQPGAGFEAVLNQVAHWFLPESASGGGR